MSAPQTIAVIGDLHYGRDRAPGRHGDIGDILLQRAVAYLNDCIAPDLTLLVGDVLDDGDAGDAPARLARLREILDGLHGPSVVVPGNHDGEVEAFYKVFDRPPSIGQVGDLRVVACVDEDRPGACAQRRAEDMDLFRYAREGYEGPLVAVQHVPVLPGGATECPFNHLDADTILEAMTASQVRLCVSGHYHPGLDPIQAGPTTLVTAPALYREPFELLVVRLEGDRVDAARHALRVDPALGLADYHLHTEFGYCAQDVAFARALDIGQRFGMAQLGFAEHSGQLYYAEDPYWQGACHREGVDGVAPDANRMEAYFAAAAAVRASDVRVGLELDFDYHGRAVLLPRDRERADYLLGSIHRLACLDGQDWEARTVVEAFCWMVDRIVEQDVDIMAHPFRIIRRDDIVLTRKIIEHVVEALDRSDTAAEINFHMGGPPVEFVTMCMDRDVKLALGGDAHHLLDIGNFGPHLALLKQAGAPSDLSEVLLYLDPDARS